MGLTPAPRRRHHAHSSCRPVRTSRSTRKTMGLTPAPRRRLHAHSSCKPMLPAAVAAAAEGGKVAEAVDPRQRRPRRRQRQHRMPVAIPILTASPAMVAGSVSRHPSIPDRWVNAHNYWRCLHGSNPICWDADFATGAQEWADRGQFSHADCYHIPPPQGPAGENLAGGSHMSPERACDMWHDENPERGPQCGGHCTAMLWNSATKLGCGIYNDGEIMVCRYGGGDPLPNFGGSSNYAANVGFPDDSREQQCSEEWPQGEGILGDNGNGGGGGGFGGGGGRGGKGRGSGGCGGGWNPFGGGGGFG